MHRKLRILLCSEAGIRAKADLREKHMRSKIKEHRKMAIPYLLVVGDRDVENREVSVRLRTDEDKGSMPLDAFRDMVVELIKSCQHGPVPAG